MKLFKSLLVAPAAFGLLSPLASQATEVNLDEISNYLKKPLNDSSSPSPNTTGSCIILAR